MRREYFLADSLDVLDEAVAVLHDGLHIEDKNIHIISQDTDGIKQHHLHSANIIHKSDIIRGAEQGTIIGFIFGITILVCALLSAPFWVMSIPLKQMILLAVLSTPIMMGCLIGASIGLIRTNYKIIRFNNELNSGHHLMLVDSMQLERIKDAMEALPVMDKGETNTLILPFEDVKESYQKAA